MKRNVLFLIGSLGIGSILSGVSLAEQYFYPNANKEQLVADVGHNEGTFPINQDTTFEIEHVYVNEQRVLTEEIACMPNLIGYSKEQLEAYLKEYPSYMTVSERQDGLISYELISYNGNHVCLRKSYDKQQEQNGFYAKSYNGNIVILNSDGKTVYEYTPIMLYMLPAELRIEVQEGIYLESEEELYNFLENYST